MSKIWFPRSGALTGSLSWWKSFILIQDGWWQKSSTRSCWYQSVWNNETAAIRKNITNVISTTEYGKGDILLRPYAWLDATRSLENAADLLRYGMTCPYWTLKRSVAMAQSWCGSVYRQQDSAGQRGACCVSRVSNAVVHPLLVIRKFCQVDTVPSMASLIQWSHHASQYKHIYLAGRKK